MNYGLNLVILLPYMTSNKKENFFNEKKYIPKYYYRNYNQYKNYFDRNGYRQGQFYEFPDDDDSGSEDYYDDYEGRRDDEYYYKKTTYYYAKKSYCNN